MTMNENCKEAAHRSAGKTFLSVWCVCEMLNVFRPEGEKIVGGRLGWNGEFTCQNMRKIMASEFIQFRTFSSALHLSLFQVVNFFFSLFCAFSLLTLRCSGFSTFNWLLLHKSFTVYFVRIHIQKCRKNSFSYFLQLQNSLPSFFNSAQQIMSENSTFIRCYFNRIWFECRISSSYCNLSKNAKKVGE